MLWAGLYANVSIDDQQTLPCRTGNEGVPRPAGLDRRHVDPGDRLRVYVLHNLRQEPTSGLFSVGHNQVDQRLRGIEAAVGEDSRQDASRPLAAVSGDQAEHDGRDHDGYDRPGLDTRAEEP